MGNSGGKMKKKWLVSGSCWCSFKIFSAQIYTCTFSLTHTERSDRKCYEIFGWKRHPGEMWYAVCELVHPTADNREIALENTQSWKKSSGWWWNSYESVCVWLCICVCERQQHRKRQLKVECVSVEGVPYNGEGPPVYTSLPPAFFSGPPLEGLIADSQLTALWEPSTGTTKNSWSLRGLPEREREGHGEERAWRIGKIEQE